MGGPTTNSQLKSRFKRKRTAEPSKTGTGSGKRRSLYHCNYCRKDISNTVRIKCAVCADFDLCLECFSVGVSVTPHDPNHAYRVVDNLSFPLYHPAWGADEEMLLLEAIDISGLGNWATVADHVGTKSAAECREHYFTIYVHSPNFPLPQPVPEMEFCDPLQMAKDRRAARQSDAHLTAAAQFQPSGVRGKQRPLTPKPAPEAIAAEGAGLVKVEEGGAAEVKPVVIADDSGLVGALRPSGQQDVAMVDSETPAPPVLEALGDLPPGPPHEASPTPSSQTGAAEMQDDINSQGDNRAAKKIRRGTSPAASLKVKAAEPAQEFAAGTQKEQTSTRGLPSMRTATGAAAEAAEKSTPILGRDGMPNGLPKVGGHQVEMTGFHAKRSEFDHEFDNDAELLIAELEFLPSDTPEERLEKEKLVEVYNARLTERERRRATVLSHGLLHTKRLQANERRQSSAERDAHNRLRVFARFQTPAEHEAFVDGLILEQRLRARLEELKQLRIAGIRTFEDAEVYESEKRRKAAEAGRVADRSQRYMARTGTDDSSVVSQAVVASITSAESGSRTRELSRLRNSSGGQGGAPPQFGREPVNTTAQLAAWRSRRGVALDVTALPGTELLSAKERELCAGTRLLPPHYLAMKGSLLREGQRRGGFLPRSEARSMFRMEPALAARVYDFLLACGWLPGVGDAGGQAADVSAMEEDTLEDTSHTLNAASPASSSMHT